MAAAACAAFARVIVLGGGIVFASGMLGSQTSTLKVELPNVTTPK